MASSALQPPLHAPLTATQLAASARAARRSPRVGAALGMPQGGVPPAHAVGGWLAAGALGHAQPPSAQTSPVSPLSEAPQPCLLPVRRPLPHYRSTENVSFPNLLTLIHSPTVGGPQVEEEEEAKNLATLAFGPSTRDTGRGALILRARCLCWARPRLVSPLESPFRAQRWCCTAASWAALLQCAAPAAQCSPTLHCNAARATSC